MKSFANFSEDLQTRRLELRQRQQDQAASFRDKGVAVNQAAADRLAAQKEKASAESKKAAERRQALKNLDKQRQSEKEAAKIALNIINEKKIN